MTLAQRIAARRNDAAYMGRLRRLVARERPVLDLLAQRDSGAVASRRWHPSR